MNDEMRNEICCSILNDTEKCKFIIFMTLSQKNDVVPGKKLKSTLPLKEETIKTKNFP